MGEMKPTTWLQVQRIAEKAAAEWFSKNATDEAIRQHVFDSLEDEREEVIAKLLGFDNGWFEGWEVDHCNGRDGESAAGDFLRSQVKPSVNAWLAEQAGNLPDLPKAAISALRKQYTKMLRDQVHYALAKMADRHSEGLAEMLMDQIIDALPDPLKETMEDE